MLLKEETAMDDMNQRYALPAPQGPEQEGDKHTLPEPEKKPGKKSGRFKSFLSTLSAGVIGSALTLAAVNYTDFNPTGAIDQETNAAEATQNNNGPAKLVPAETSAKQGSVADMVEIASKAIVGV